MREARKHRSISSRNVRNFLLKTFRLVYIFPLRPIHLRIRHSAVTLDRAFPPSKFFLDRNWNSPSLSLSRIGAQRYSSLQRVNIAGWLIRRASEYGSQFTARSASNSSRVDSTLDTRSGLIDIDRSRAAFRVSRAFRITWLVILSARHLDAGPLIHR